MEYEMTEVQKKGTNNKVLFRMKSKAWDRIRQSKSIHHVKEFYNWDFEDDERRAIRDWSKDRIKKMQGFRRSYHGFLVYSFHLSTLRSFIENFNIVVLIQMMLAGGAVYLFQFFNIAFEFNVALVVSPIVFPLAFSINTDFQRREKVLDDLANFKSGAMLWFFCMREWRETAELDQAWLNAVQKKVHSMMFNLREYLLTERIDRRNMIARYMYEDFSDTSQLIERVRASKLPANTSIVSRVIHLLNNMCLSFERLRVIREYRSPRSIRAFNKVLILLLPIILSPYFVSMSQRNSDSPWCAYVVAVLVAGVFGALQGVQDKLDDPFDGMSEDDINLDTIDEWTFTSLDTAATRNIVVGRFHVSKNVDDLETAALARKKSMAEYLHTIHDGEDSLDEQIDSVIHKKRPFQKRKSAKSLFRRSTKKNNPVNRSKTFGSIDKNSRQERYSTSSYTFAPQLHPYANVLENMTGDARITRKLTQRRAKPMLSNRSISLDDAQNKSTQPTGSKLKTSSVSDYHLISVAKDIPLEDEEYNLDDDVISSPRQQEQPKGEVSFSPQHEVISYTPSSSFRKKKVSYENFPSKEPLLMSSSTTTSPPQHTTTTPPSSKSRFKLEKADGNINGVELDDTAATTPSINTSPNSKHDKTANRKSLLSEQLAYHHDDDELRQVVVVNGNDGSYKSEGNDVFS